jgi:hypothetical protein
MYMGDRFSSGNDYDVMIIAGLIRAASQGLVNARVGVIIIAKLRMRCFDPCAHTLINFSLKDERTHVSFGVQIKDFNIDLTVSCLEVAGAFLRINIGCGRTAGYDRGKEDNGYKSIYSLHVFFFHHLI